MFKSLSKQAKLVALIIAALFVILPLRAGGEDTSESDFPAAKGEKLAVRRLAVPPPGRFAAVKTTFTKAELKNLVVVARSKAEFMETIAVFYQQDFPEEKKGEEGDKNEKEKKKKKSKKEKLAEARKKWLESLKIDFDKEMVLAVFTGVLPGTGSVEVKIDEVRVAEGKLHANYVVTDKRVSTDTSVSYVLNYDLVVCPRHKIPVIFYKNDKKIEEVEIKALITTPFELFLSLLAIILLSVYLEKRYAFAKKISTILIVLFISAICSNFGLIALESPFYGQLNGVAVPLAVCLVLFTISIAEIKKAGMPMLVAFAIASLGTFVGALVAGVALDPVVQQIEGIGAANSWKITGPYTGTYIGGSLNFAALWEELKLGKAGEGSLWGAANAADYIITLVLFPFLMIVPEKLRKFYPVAKIWRKNEDKEEKTVPEKKQTMLHVFDIVALVSCALGILWISKWFNANVIVKHIYKDGAPTILIYTTFALILAQFKWIKKLAGAKELSNIAFYFFFAAIGATCDVVKAIKIAPVLVLFTLVIFCIHMIIVFGIGRLAKLEPRLLAVASMAAKGGPSSVVMITNVKKWDHLLISGIAVALLGYAVGNYIGLSAAHLVRWMLGAP